MTTVSISGNEATVNFADDGKAKRYTFTSNSGFRQIISTKVDDGTATEVQGAGEKAWNADVTLPHETKKVVFAFSVETGGKKQASRLNVGGPYEIGPMQIAIIVAENGDDADFNDAVVQVYIK